MEVPPSINIYFYTITHYSDVWSDDYSKVYRDDNNNPYLLRITVSDRQKCHNSTGIWITWKQNAIISDIGVICLLLILRWWWWSAPLSCAILENLRNLRWKYVGTEGSQLIRWLIKDRIRCGIVGIITAGDSSYWGLWEYGKNFSLWHGVLWPPPLGNTVTAYLIKLLGDLCPRKLFILLENTAMADVDKNYYKHAEFKVQPDMIF